jgi:hypothetical protein
MILKIRRPGNKRTERIEVCQWQTLVRRQTVAGEENKGVGERPSTSSGAGGSKEE